MLGLDIFLILYIGNIIFFCFLISYFLVNLFCKIYFQLDDIVTLWCDQSCY